MLMVFFCGRTRDLEHESAKFISDLQYAEHELSEDLEAEAHPDLEMIYARRGVDPYAPEPNIEVERPEIFEAAVIFEALY